MLFVAFHLLLSFMDKKGTAARMFIVGTAVGDY